MKFSAGDETYKSMIEAAGHELYIATQNRSNFIELRIILKNNDRRNIKSSCYQAYAEFVRGLYEYYVAVIKINETTTSLPKHYDIDAAMNDAVQRLLNFQKPFINTNIQKHLLNVPDDFGKSFRAIRNMASHTDYKRMLASGHESKSSLSDFYKKYDIYVELLLQHPQFTWGGKHYEISYKWDAIEDFIATISNGV